MTGTTYHQRTPEESQDVKFAWVVGIAITFVMGLAVLGIYLSPEHVDESPKVGDVWEYYSSGKPFNKEGIYLREVIDIKKGYVQFVENERDTLSPKITLSPSTFVCLELI
jgi:hypothetical protein